MKIEFSSHFKRAFKKRILNNIILEKRFHERLNLLQLGPFNTKLETHKLSGLLKGKLAFSVSYDCRVVFSFKDENTIVLLDIGTHDQVY